MNLRKLFGKRIKNIRKSLSLTQEDFADSIGIHRSSLARIENGESFPSPETLEKIKIITEMNYSQIFDFDNENIPKNLQKGLIIKLEQLDNTDLNYFIKNIEIYKQAKTKNEKQRK